MMGAGSKDEQHDVSDSTDWLGTPLAGLAPIDAALRCQVCKDFYQTPMITSCSHTFCSICIRRCLANDGKCPACRASEQENKLRSNWAFEGLVDDFLRARSTILTYARCQSSYTGHPSPKRNIEEVELDSEGQGEPRKRTRSSYWSSARSKEGNKAAVLDEDADDADYQPADGLAKCPVCSNRMKMESIDAHLNICLDEFSRMESAISQSTSGIGALVTNGAVDEKPSNKIERLPHLNYSLFKEAALRKKLQDLGLSGQGNKQLLERRHTEWVTLWNANCDASKPRKKTELLRELGLWERTQGSRAPSSSSGINTGSQLLHKDFDGAGWAAKHDQSFQDLIANARKNLEKRENKLQLAGITEQALSVVKESPGSLVVEEKEISDVSTVIVRPTSQSHASTLTHHSCDQLEGPLISYEPPLNEQRYGISGNRLSSRTSEPLIPSSSVLGSSGMRISEDDSGTINDRRTK